MTDDVLVTFRVCKLCSGARTASVSFIQYGLVKHDIVDYFLTFSAILNFYDSDT